MTLLTLPMPSMLDFEAYVLNTIHPDFSRLILLLGPTACLGTRYGVPMVMSRLGIVKSLACITNAHLQCNGKDCGCQCHL